MYDGAASPMTQTFGLGIFEPPSAAAVETLERFFQERGAPVHHEVSPLADSSLVPLMVSRGYHPLEFTSVMFRPIDRALTFAANPAIMVTLVESGDDSWVQTAAKGWSDYPELETFVLEIGRVQGAAEQLHRFIAAIDGEPVAAGGLAVHDGVALLAGASTVPAARRRGAQLALLAARLRFAVEQGCDLAMMCALPGSGSQRNAERHGFRIAYTRIKWLLK